MRNNTPSEKGMARARRRVEWRLTWRAFWHRNKTPLTLIAAVFIIIEGCVAWFYPAQWWKPVIAVLAVTAIIIAWRNLKAVMKFAISLAVTVVLAALGVQSGYVYGGIDIAAVWGTSILTGWALVILFSYLIKPMGSRWTIALVSSTMGFTVGYAFMILGPVAISVSTILASVLTYAGFLGMEAWRRRTRAAIRPSKWWNDTSRARTRKAMLSLWPNMREARLKLMGSWEPTVWFGDDDPTIILIPIDLDQSFKSSKRYGITYHHRNIRTTALWLVDTAVGSVPGPTPVVIFIDVNGKNRESQETGEIMAFQKTDSHMESYAGIIDGSTSARKIRTSIMEIMRRFKGLEKSRAKAIMQIEKTVVRDSDAHDAKEAKRKSRESAKLAKTNGGKSKSVKSKSSKRPPVESPTSHGKGSNNNAVDWDDGEPLYDADHLNAAIDKIIGKK